MNRTWSLFFLYISVQIQQLQMKEHSRAVSGRVRGAARSSDSHDMRIYNSSWESCVSFKVVF